MSVDYKKKYLKYKTKYLEARKVKQMTGGELHIEQELNKIMGAMKIDNKAFESLVKTSNENILVIVYAHWCGHCVNMVKNIGEKLKSDINNTRIKYLDGTKLSEDLKQKLEVRGFPTIIKIQNSSDINNLKKKEYEGARDVNAIINFLNE